MTDRTVGSILKGSGIALDVFPPLIATITQFPVWVNRSGEASVSGLFLVFGLLCCVPFFKQIKEWFKSPSSVVMWVVMFVVFSVVRSIIDEMIVICLIGAVSNGLGTVLYKLGIQKTEKDAKKPKEA